MIKYCVLTTVFDKKGIAQNEEHEFETPEKANKFLSKLSKTIARQTYIKETRQVEVV